jgi:hypothetical protein
MLDPWQAYGPRFYGVRLSDTVTMSAQEHAHTSPIW